MGTCRITNRLDNLGEDILFYFWRFVHNNNLCTRTQKGSKRIALNLRTIAEADNAFVGIHVHGFFAAAVIQFFPDILIVRKLIFNLFKHEGRLLRGGGNNRDKTSWI